METLAAQDDVSASPTVAPPPPESRDQPTSPPPRKPVHSLVIDSGPIIKNDPPVSALLAQAEELYTIPSVVSEIRDEAARARLQTTLLPFLKLRSPRPESIKFVSDFARRTGDLEVLSRPDIHLLALTYELECERNGGDWRLRKTPAQKGVNGKPNPVPSSPSSPPAGKDDDTATAQDETPTQEGATATQEDATAQDETPTEESAAAIQEDAAAKDEIAAEGSVAAVQEDATAQEEIPKDDPAISVEEALCDFSLKPEDATSTTAVPSGGQQQSARDTAVAIPLPAAGQEDDQAAGTSRDDDESGDDSGSEGGWITPSNIKKHQEKHQEGAPAQPIQRLLQAAILTSDYAMQNVSLRMNLNLLNPGLMRITRVKSWVLRCHGCFAVTRKMDRQFCPSCGQATLTRTSCSTDQRGNFSIHLKRNYQFNKRGNVYSVPKPVHGSASGKNAPGAGGGKNGWGRDLILAEDEKEYLKKTDEARRVKYRDLMDEDYLPNVLSGERNGQRRIRVGAGRNVNSKKR